MIFSKNKKTVAYPWRQNFRDEKLLPDLKIVRTHFIYNAMAVGFLCVFAGLFVYQEYSVSVSSDVLKDLNVQIDKLNVADKNNQAASAGFSREANRLLEAARFAEVPVLPEAFFAALARVQVPNGRYSSLSFSRVAGGKNPNAASFQMSIEGMMSPSVDGSAPAEIGKFIEKLRSMPIWRDCERNVELLTSAPSDDLNSFSYSIKLTWKPGREAAAK